MLSFLSKKTYSKPVFIFSFLLLLFISSCAPSLAAEYIPLSPVPGATESLPEGSDQNLSIYLRALYNFLVGAAAALAVIVVIWGGFEYMTTDAIGHKEEGKQKIQNAVLGLLLALGSYIILKTINADLLSLSFDVSGLKQVEIKEMEQGSLSYVNEQGYIINEDGSVSYNGQSTNYHVDAAGNLYDNNDQPVTDANGTIINTGGANMGRVSNNSLAQWGDPAASTMQSKTVSGVRSYYAPGESKSDSYTDAGLGAYGPLVFGNDNTVGSAASVYYPAGTLIRDNGDGRTYIVDDNNINGKTGRPANNALTNNYTIDIATQNKDWANGGAPSTNTTYTVLYVPTTKVNSYTQIQDIRNNSSKYISGK